MGLELGIQCVIAEPPLDLHHYALASLMQFVMGAALSCTSMPSSKAANGSSIFCR